MAGLLDKYLPGLALRRMQARLLLVRAQRAYEAAKDTRLRRRPKAQQSPDAAMGAAGDKLRNWARHLDENNDLAIGVLDVLVNNIVGTGITVEPMVLQKNGKPAERINKQLRQAWQRWIEKPEVTGELAFSEVQRLACRSWLRDGEILTQHVIGEGAPIEHLGGVPYSLELIEADYLPYMLTDTSKGLIHGVVKNTWGRPVAYRLYLEHPGNTYAGSALPNNSNTKEVSAERITHLKFTRRVKQTRGVTIFHGVIKRLDDVSDYEESERIAARVAAAFTGFIRKNPDAPLDTNTEGDRTFSMEPGLIFDNLLPGEEIGTVASNRPNSGLQDFRNAMLRAVAAGTGASYSSISKDYSGTFSSQRQELSESMPSYRRLREYFISAFMKDVYRNFVDMALLSGQVKAPARLLDDAIYMADYGGVALPWIDPKKEMDAEKTAVAEGFKSRHQVIRERGGDPRIVDEQLRADPLKPASAPAPATTTQAATAEAGPATGAGAGADDSESNEAAA